MAATRTLRLAFAASLACAITAGLVSRSASVVSAAAGNVSISPQDTYLNVNTTNYSTSTTLSTYTWPDNQAANTVLMKFSLSAIPASSLVTNATLQLALVGSDSTSDATYTVTLHKVIGLNPNLAKANGATYDGKKKWAASSCCYNGMPLAESNISPAYASQAIDKTAGFKAWDVTQLVREWLANPSSNFGLLLNADMGKTKDHFRTFASAEYGDASLRPVLVVTLGGTSDTTPPTVSITAPSSGASIAGTAAVKASASDNVGVVGVQFQMNGQNVGSEVTTSPYSISMDTTKAANGSYTLSAIARDASGNRSTASIPVTVSNSTSSGGSTGTIASSFPGDVGIENDPRVVFVERFDESSLSNLFGRWTDIKNGSAMTFSTDVPSGSTTRSLNIPWTAGGANDGGHLYRQLLPGVNDTLYVRYYIKYPAAGNYSHTGIWMGGYNPPLSWPNPQAGLKPTGNDRFSVSAEQNTLTNRFDHYDYWMGMHQSLDGNYWGNLLLNNPSINANLGQWTCVEQMVKLNNPVSSSNGEHAVWLNDVKVSHLGQGFPNGTWSGGTFTQTPNGTPFQGFQWRNDASLNLNWLWLQVYAPSDTANGSIKFANVVAATSRVGCLTSGGSSSTSPSDITAPTVSVTAPTGGSTVSGNVTVTASATDNVGVVGVQFKLDGANLGGEYTAAPYSMAWNSSSVGNGSHTLSAVARDAAGNTKSASNVTVNVSNTTSPPPSGSGSWPNEPAGFRVINDNPWNTLSGNGWQWARRTSSQDPTIFSDSSAPFSPTNMLQMIFTPDMQRDSEPSVHWMGLSQPREIYTSWWMKLSPNWTPSPAGGGKITFLWAPDGQGQVYSNIGGSSAPHRININTEWAPYGQNFWEPNVSTTPINYGQWYRIEWYVKYETSPGAGNGIIRWWVNGVLNGDYRNVRFPGCCFQQFEFAPTMQLPPPSTQYMYIDHVHVSTP